ncbi:MAG: winged helix-turn-helix domain-containing protein, partial [Phycisphaerales bacterium]
AAGGGDRGTLRLGPIVADLAAHQITVDGIEARMTLTEFRLLVALLQAPGRVVSRQDLISRVMGPGIVITTRTVDVHV